MAQLSGKTAMITGGARGQGRSHALRLAADGADIVLVDLCRQIETVPYEMATGEELEQTAAEVRELGRRCLALEGDVRDEADMAKACADAVGELGGVDILVSNAGIWSLDPFWEMTVEKWQDAIDVNLTGHWLAARAVAPQMIDRGSGVIVFISSVNGLEAGVQFAHYAAAKHGLIGLAKSIAVEAGRHGIRSHVVCPGFIDTKMNDYQGCYDLMAGAPPGEGTPEARVQAAGHYSALKGTGLIQPESVSNTVAFLVSDEARDLNGVILPVDAGHVALPSHNPAPF